MTPCSTLEQRWSACRKPSICALRDAESQEQFEAINLALDACGVPDAEGYDNGCDTASRHWGVALVVPHRRPCTSPRRHQCRAGLSEHGYDVRAEWWLKLHDAGGSPEPMQIYGWCELPF